MKEFLSREDVPFQERRVDADEDAYNEFMALNVGRGVPVITVDDEKIIGFDQARLTTVLGLRADT